MTTSYHPSPLLNTSDRPEQCLFRRHDDARKHSIADQHSVELLNKIPLDLCNIRAKSCSGDNSINGLEYTEYDL